MPTGSTRVVHVGGRVLQTTPVFDTYWRFAAERQRVYMVRVHGDPPPWTSDPVIGVHRFTNAYRAADRVSQALIDVQYRGPQDVADIVLRTLLFKFFNKTETWNGLVAAVGEPTAVTFDVGRYRRVLDEMVASGVRIYSAAYIMPSPPYGEAKKHGNHLLLLDDMLERGLPDEVAAASSLSQVFDAIAAYPSIGPFLGYQFAVDLNYSAAINHDESSFVVAGPGATDGIRKCFVDTGGLPDEVVIEYMQRHQDEHFTRLGLQFPDLWGRRLQLIDCQNLFCETGKYARVAHPEYSGRSGRTRIKQAFRAKEAPRRPWFPPKWGINERIAAEVPSDTQRPRDTLF